MKTRIIVSVISVPLLFAMIFLLPLWALGIFIATVSALASYELLNCALPKPRKRFYAYAAATGIAQSAGFSLGGRGLLTILPAFLLMLVSACELIISLQKDSDENRLGFSDILVLLFAGLILPVMLSSILRIGRRENDPFFLLLPFLATFASDSGAYFAGTFLGKHKLIPKVSPSKTVEGSVGGFVCTISLLLLYGLLLVQFGYTVNFPALGIYAFLGSAACQIGDLFFSALKRGSGIKDYGSLIPGHGGVLDRFDGMHFAAPVIEFLLFWFSAISK